MKKILVMAAGNSVHAERWISGLSLEDTFDIYLVSMNPMDIRSGIINNPKVRGAFKVVSRAPFINSSKYSYLKSYNKIRKIVKSLKPDIISTVHLTSYGFFGALLKGKALLCHFAIGSDIMKTPYKNSFFKWITKFTLSKGDYFVCPSNVMAKEIYERYSIPKKKLLVQQYGVGDEVINYPKQHKIYDFISNRGWQKNSNIPLIIKIFSHLPSSMKLVMISDNGDLEEEKKIEIKNRLVSMLNVKHITALPYMQNIDAVAKSKFIISLTSSDGASLSVIEAMAVGTIPVVSDIAPNREWIEDGVNGFLIDLGTFTSTMDKINAIISLPDEKLEVMRMINYDIVRQRCNFTKNMQLFNKHVLTLANGDK